MRALDQGIERRDQELAGRHIKQRGIVADAEHHPGLRAAGRPSPGAAQGTEIAIDQVEFADRHGGVTVRSRAA